MLDSYTVRSGPNLSSKSKTVRIIIINKYAIALVTKSKKLHGEKGGGWRDSGWSYRVINAA